MSSLAGREGLTGQVQMIFFDPPYGIGFKSNYQTKTNDLNTAENRNGLPNDTRTLTAFRDTYERGTHSYLDQMLEKLTLCRELLTDSGSVFVQIGEENLHRMALVLDEVFGSENRVSQITFATTGGSSSSTLPSVSSYLLWYAKDKGKVKYRQLYEPLDRKGIVELFSWHAHIEQADGTTRSLTAAETADPDNNIPKNSRLYKRTSLRSIGVSTTGRSEPYNWKGVEFQCGDTLHWSVSPSGMDRLAELNRLDASADSDAHLTWKRYEEEVPGRRISNVWHRQMQPSDKRYVVQTADSVIERCVLMATDPGDLVFDPTCGSGTTAFVSEVWGRRWITCDTSPISVAIARQRLVTSTYPYWVLADSASSKDPAKGFIYNSVPYVSAGILAYDKEAEPTLLVDSPEEDKKIARVASSFTVESSSPWVHVPFGDETDQVPQHRPVEYADFVERVLVALKLNPISSGRSSASDGSDIQITEIEPWQQGTLVSHLVSYTPADDQAKKPKHAGLFVVPEDVSVSGKLLRQMALAAATQIDDADLVIVVAFAFEAETNHEKVGRINVMRVQMHRDLQLSDLKTDKGHQAFVMVGQPDVEVHAEKNGELAVELLGFDTYDPTNGNVKAGGKDDVGCWMIDTDYDGESFFARRIHFPGADDDKIMKRLKKELGNTLDQLRWDRMLSTKSAPFPPPETGQIAVKIITTAGNEMSVVKEI